LSDLERSLQEFTENYLKGKHKGVQAMIKPEDFKKYLEEYIQNSKKP